MKNEINRALVAKKKLIVTFILAALLPISLMAQITEPGATNPNQLYTTTYDNPTGPNHAPGGPHRTPISQGEVGGEDNWDKENSPIGAPWVLLAFAAAYGTYATFRLSRRRKGE